MRSTLPSSLKGDKKQFIIYNFTSIISKAYLSLGSNLGNREKYLEQARTFLKELGKIKKESSVLETPAWGKTNQPNFLNQVILIETKLFPHDLLKECQKIENKLGRERKVKWGARTIDIDILFYDNLVLNEENLTIPHPYISEREFVLEPLNEIAPDFVYPVLGLTIRGLSNNIGLNCD